MQTMIILAFLIFGSCNVFLIKWTTILQGKCSDGEWRYFQHPVFLTFLMFLGECLCLVIYKIAYCFLRRRNNGSEDSNLLTSGDREFRPMDMLLPAFLNTIATILFVSGIYLTYASSFQAIRCSTIIFIGLFGSIYLNQTLIGRHWSAIVIIVCALTIIISTDMQRVVFDNTSLSHPNKNAILAGDLLILCATIFQAAKMIYHEKYVKACNVPILQALGWQGIFGLVITSCLAICTNFLPTPMSPFNDSSRKVYDDLQDIFTQIQSNQWLVAALCIMVFTTAVHGYTALSIIRFSSSANLILAESIGSYLVWLWACLLEWEQLYFVTIIGYIILMLGLITYRKAVIMEWYRSIILHIARNRYAEMSVDPSEGMGGTGVPTNRAADVI
ncbi:solute carrier family 35 member F6 [Stomoxys calcitrans]|uniref:solute carrier family 35 member F6 n=1 Tax=Stomoxys calcitrans TaxID=35570 RepID=UPI0027E2DB36|nr:solute carrier family 35 member F6 [Stomoxys calcitrans]